MYRNCSNCKNCVQVISNKQFICLKAQLDLKNIKDADFLKMKSCFEHEF
jgi:hypothetical protein